MQPTNITNVSWRRGNLLLTFKNSSHHNAGIPLTLAVLQSISKKSKGLQFEAKNQQTYLYYNNSIILFSIIIIFNDFQTNANKDIKERFHIIQKNNAVRAKWNQSTATAEYINTQTIRNIQ